MMKQKQKTIYYCDFCKKHRFIRNAMERHESSCTLNPNRVCGVRGCKGDCPWCEFSKKRLIGEYVDSGLLGEEMQAWWAKKGNQWVMNAYDGAAYEAIYR